MDAFTHAREFQKLCPKVDVRIYTSMLEDEAKAERERIKRLRYEASLDIAAERIIDWYRTANYFAVDVSDLGEVARFVGSHRHATVWAVLLGKAGIQAQARAATESK